MLKNLSRTLLGVGVCCSALVAAAFFSPALSSADVASPSPSTRASDPAAWPNSAASQESAQAVPPSAHGSVPISASDQARVQAVGYLLSTRIGAHVKVSRASGSEVWGKLFPDVTVGPETEVITSHDLLVIESTEAVPQSGYHQGPATQPVTVGRVSIVVDTTNGRVLERTFVPTGDMHTASALAGFPTVSDVTLVDVAPPPSI